MESVHVLRIIVASPGDVQAERDALPAVLEELNRGIAAAHGLRLELRALGDRCLSWLSPARTAGAD